VPETRRLPPFPDELVDPERKDSAVLFLLELGIPARLRAASLSRWARYVGLELTAADFERVRSAPIPPGL